jgi:hypothetical protein
MGIAISGGSFQSREAAKSTIEAVLEPHLGPDERQDVLGRELCLDDDYDRSGVLVLPDGVTIDGDLILDFDAAEYEGRPFRGVIALGQLNITGDLLAENSDGAPFLVVRGGLNVRHIIKGAAPLIVGGPLVVSGLAYIFYNHGHFRAYGGLEAPGLIVDDQGIDIRGPVAVAVQALDVADLADVLSDDLLEEDEDGNIVVMEDYHEELVERIKAGQPVLRSPRKP